MDHPSKGHHAEFRACRHPWQPAIPRLVRPPCLGPLPPAAPTHLPRPHPHGGPRPRRGFVRPWQAGITGLIQAASKGQEAVVRLLIEHKAEVDAASKVLRESQTPPAADTSGITDDLV